MTETKTYRGKNLDEVLPQIRAELGDDAIILRRREGIVGGIGGFFGRRCVEVDAIASPVAAAPTVALPASTVFDAYDAGNGNGADDGADDGDNPVIRTMMDQAHPFAQALQAAELRVESVATDDDPGDDEPGEDTAAQEFQAIGFPPAAGDGDWEAAASQAVAAGLPSAVVENLARDARRTMQPFAQDTTPLGLLERALARQIKVEHGWRTKRRTIALVGAAGAGKTLTAAKLCHAYATGSTLAVRTLSLEPPADAYRLGALTEHLDIGLRVAQTPETAARAAARMSGESLIVVDTPPVSATDPDGIADLASLLEAVRPDETHLVIPAWADARATAELYEAITAHFPITRLTITRLDEVSSVAPAVGLSFTFKRPLAYVTDGRRQIGGLRPADAAELAALALPVAELEAAA
jgi:flagellar biosynthesis protein FlhF